MIVKNMPKDQAEAIATVRAALTHRDEKVHIESFMKKLNDGNLDVLQNYHDMLGGACALLELTGTSTLDDAIKVAYMAVPQHIRDEKCDVDDVLDS